MPVPLIAKRSTLYSLILSGAALLAVLISSWYVGRALAQEDVPADMPPAPSVEVATLETHEIRRWEPFSGRLAAVDSADIKPLVGGTIQQVLFEEGELVEQGQPLFVIDPRPHQAAMKRAEAQLAAAKARSRVQAEEKRRAEKLLRDRLISQSQFDQTDSTARMAKAAVDEAEANLMQARLNLEYAHIAAPVSGRISRAELTVGNVVEAGPNAPVLASIVSYHRLYVEFNVDEQTYIRLVRSVDNADTLPVQLTLDADQSVAYQGRLHAFDNRIDPASGTIRARAIFTNTDGALTPGMFASISLGSAGMEEAVLIPERAIGTNQSKKFVYVVDADNLALYREIALGSQWNGYRIVAAGLQPGDRVIVNGLSHVWPNTPVNPVEIELSLAENSQRHIDF